MNHATKRKLARKLLSRAERLKNGSSQGLFTVSGLFGSVAWGQRVGGIERRAAAKQGAAHKRAVQRRQKEDTMRLGIAHTGR